MQWINQNGNNLFYRSQKTLQLVSSSKFNLPFERVLQENVTQASEGIAEHGIKPVGISIFSIT